jgi:hypothetical protein
MDERYDFSMNSHFDKKKWRYEFAGQFVLVFIMNSTDTDWEVARKKYEYVSAWQTC